MTKKNYHRVLGLPRDATAFQIRAAYAYLIGRIEAGEPSPARRQAIDEAYAALSDPLQRQRSSEDAVTMPLSAQFLVSVTQAEPQIPVLWRRQPARRVLGVAARSLQPSADASRTVRLPAGGRDAQGAPRRIALPLVAGAVALLVIAGMSDAILPRAVSKRPAPSPVIVGRAVPTPIPADDAGSNGGNGEAPAVAAAPPSTSAGSATADTGAGETVSSAPLPPPAAPQTSPVLARPALAPVRVPAIAAVRPQPAAARPVRPAPNYAGALADTAAPAVSLPAPDDGAATVAADESTATASMAPAAAAPARVSVVASSPFGRSGTAAFVGRYCQDATGGSVFVAVGAAPPNGLTCNP